MVRVFEWQVVVRALLKLNREDAAICCGDQNESGSVGKRTEMIPTELKMNLKYIGGFLIG